MGWILQKVQQGIGNPNSLALLITGLTAAGQATDVPVQELLGFYLGEGRFESSFLPGEADAFATKQAVRALSEALDGASFFTSVRLNPAGLQEGAQEDGTQEVLEQCLAAYGGKAADWEELSAIYAALAKGDYTKGVSLEEVTLPALPQEPSSALFQALMTGDLEAARQAAETLVQEGELADPGYGYGYALNLLAAEAGNRSAEVPLSYDRQQAAEKLLGYRYEGGPGYGYSYDGVYSDDFDTAGLALAALTLLRGRGDFGAAGGKGGPFGLDFAKGAAGDWKPELPGAADNGPDGGGAGDRCAGAGAAGLLPGGGAV